MITKNPPVSPCNPATLFLLGLVLFFSVGCASSFQKIEIISAGELVNGGEPMLVDLVVPTQDNKDDLGKYKEKVNNWFQLNADIRRRYRHLASVAIDPKDVQNSRVVHPNNKEKYRLLLTKMVIFPPEDSTMMNNINEHGLFIWVGYTKTKDGIPLKADQINRYGGNAYISGTRLSSGKVLRIRLGEAQMSWSLGAN
jgi:hypothetical protein